MDGSERQEAWYNKIMRDFIMANEPTIRLSVFLGIFAAVALFEALAPRRPRSLSRLARWPGKRRNPVLIEQKGVQNRFSFSGRQGAVEHSLSSRR